ncbi:MAG TPA: PQQ-binding-like beta-propeller repeat protein [Roseiarcus sp.]|nr:PQQ-binding-like beta-propeller repeat protein [Roseiarcus sp.]
MRNALLAGALGVAVSVASAQADQSVLTYHGALDRAGRYVVPGLTYERARGLHLDPSFHPAFQGHVYAQPLLWRRPGSGQGVLIVATEEDEVFAFDAKSGAQIWKRSLGGPVPGSVLPCGNISPLGVTGAPVIDEACGTIYLDAAVMRANAPRHEIYALSLADGSVEPGWPVDVATALGGRFTPALENQRGALALLADKVFVPFSGHWGDCGAYHGFVVGLSTGEPRQAASFETRARGGGIWGQGGVSSDGKSLFAATGNTFGASQWSDGEAVLRFGSDLAPPHEARDFFAPTDWRDLDRYDLDLGGTAATPLDVANASGTRKLIFEIGKSGEAYLLDRDNLGGIGGALTSARVTTNIEIASPAVWSADGGAFVALQGVGAHCPPDKAGEGLIALKIRTDPAPAMETAWCGAVVGNGSPIVTTTDGRSDPIVLIVGAEGDNRLHAFRGDDGKPLASPPEQLRGLHHFQTLIASDDRLYVAADGTVYAFAF